jgi:hypothetical protein
MLQVGATGINQPTKEQDLLVIVYNEEFLYTGTQLPACEGDFLSATMSKPAV